MMEWIASNWQMIVGGWAASVALLKFLAMVIPGTKDDEIIVKILDAGARIMSFGASNLAGEGRVKTPQE